MVERFEEGHPISVGEMETFVIDAYKRAERFYDCLAIIIARFLSQRVSKRFLATKDAVMAYWWCRALNETLEKEAKAKVAYIYSWTNRQEEYPIYDWKDSPLNLGCKYLKKELVLKRISQPRKVELFAFQLLNLKKGTLRPGISFVTASLLKHRQLLGTPREEPVKVILDEVRRTAREIAPVLRGLLQKGLDINVRPSLSACYERSRAHGGALNELIQALDPELDWSLCWFPKTGLLKLYKPCLEGIFTQLLQEWNADGALLKATPVALLEAFKVRVITKGEAIRHWLVQPYQKPFWKALQKFSCFRLTGRPVESQDVDEMFQALSGSEKLVSGDYEAATDFLKSASSLAVIEEWQSFLDPRLWLPLKRALCGHLLDYKDGSEPVVQQNGQLMGSFISFPILCIVNAALCRAAVEFGRQRVYSLKEVPMFINGDDCLFPASNESYSWWQTMGSELGLLPSVGKNYYSSEFCVINSTEFRLRKGTISPVAVCDQTPYLNLGLLYGNKRSQSADESSVSAGSIASEFIKYRELLGECCNEEFRTDFIRLRSTLLKRVPNSWALPPHMGGLGLVDRKLTRFEKLWATFWRDHPRDRFSLTSIDEIDHPCLARMAAEELSLGGLIRIKSLSEFISDGLSYQDSLEAFRLQPNSKAGSRLATDLCWQVGVEEKEGNEISEVRRIRYMRKWQNLAKRAVRYSAPIWHGESLHSYGPCYTLPKASILFK